MACEIAQRALGVQPGCVSVSGAGHVSALSGGLAEVYADGAPTGHNVPSIPLVVRREWFGVIGHRPGPWRRLVEHVDVPRRTRACSPEPSLLTSAVGLSGCLRSRDSTSSASGPVGVCFRDSGVDCPERLRPDTPEVSAIYCLESS